MGQALSPLLLGIEKTTHLYRACTLCGSCKKTCPRVWTTHPYFSNTGRAKSKKKNAKGNRTALSRFGNLMATVASFGMRRSWAWALGMKCARPVLNFLSKDGSIKDIPFGARGWFTCRTSSLPARTFRERWKDLSNESVPSEGIAGKEVS